MKCPLVLLLLAGGSTAPIFAQCEEQILSSPALEAFDRFGYDVCLSGDTMLVSMHGDDDPVIDAGSVHIYHRNAANNWILDQKLQPDQPGAHFIFGVDVDLQGDLIAVGSSGEHHFASAGMGGEYLTGFRATYDRGAAYVFERIGNSWERTAKLHSSEPGTDHDFGWQVAVDADSILVSEPGNEMGGKDGVAYHFVRGASGWDMVQRLEPSIPGTEHYGLNIARDGDTLFVSGGGPPSEKVFVYERGASGWAEVANFEQPYQGGMFQYFGSSMAIDGDTAAIGAYVSSAAGPYQSGAVYLLERSAGTWAITQILVAPDAESGEHFGVSVDIRGDWMLVGADRANNGNHNLAGAVYRFRRTPSGFQFADVWQTENGNNTEFGFQVALGDGEAYAVGLGALPAGDSSGRVTRIPMLQQAFPYCTCAQAPSCGNPDLLAGCANSTGTGASLRSCGSTSLALDDLTLSADSLPGGQVGYLFMGGESAQAALGDGQRCVGSGAAGLFRYPAQSTGSGNLTSGPGLVASSAALFGPAGTIASGSTWYFQVWYRDPGGACGNGSNLTAAVAVTFTP